MRLLRKGLLDLFNLQVFKPFDDLIDQPELQSLLCGHLRILLAPSANFIGMLSGALRKDVVVIALSFFQAGYHPVHPLAAGQRVQAHVPLLRYVVYEQRGMRQSHAVVASLQNDRRYRQCLFYDHARGFAWVGADAVVNRSTESHASARAAKENENIGAAGGDEPQEGLVDVGGHFIVYVLFERYYATIEELDLQIIQMVVQVQALLQCSNWR